MAKVIVSKSRGLFYDHFLRREYPNAINVSEKFRKLSPKEKKNKVYSYLKEQKHDTADCDFYQFVLVQFLNKTIEVCEADRAMILLSLMEKPTGGGTKFERWSEQEAARKFLVESFKILKRSHSSFDGAMNYLLGFMEPCIGEELSHAKKYHDYFFSKKHSKFYKFFERAWNSSPNPAQDPPDDHMEVEAPS